MILDGSGSVPGGGISIVSYEWSWSIVSCDYTATSVEPTAPLRLPIGVHNVVLTMTDSIAQTYSDAILVTVSEGFLGDINNSGIVNLDDFIILRNNF